MFIMWIYYEQFVNFAAIFIGKCVYFQRDPDFSIFLIRFIRKGLQHLQSFIFCPMRIIVSKEPLIAGLLTCDMI